MHSDPTSEHPVLCHGPEDPESGQEGAVCSNRNWGSTQVLCLPEAHEDPGSQADLGFHFLLCFPSGPKKGKQRMSLSSTNTSRFQSLMIPWNSKGLRWSHNRGNKIPPSYCGEICHWQHYCGQGRKIGGIPRDSNGLPLKAQQQKWERTPTMRV